MMTKNFKVYFWQKIRLNKKIGFQIVQINNKKEKQNIAKNLKL